MLLKTSTTQQLTSELTKNREAGRMSNALCFVDLLALPLTAVLGNLLPSLGVSFMSLEKRQGPFPLFWVSDAFTAFVCAQTLIWAELQPVLELRRGAEEKAEGCGREGDGCLRGRLAWTLQAEFWGCWWFLSSHRKALGAGTRRLRLKFWTAPSPCVKQSGPGGG